MAAAGVLAMVPARTLKRMLGRSVGWVFDAEYGAVLGVNAQDRLYLDWTGWQPRAGGLGVPELPAPCLTDCLKCLSCVCCLSRVSVLRAAGTSAPLVAAQSRDEIKCHFRIGRLNPAQSSNRLSIGRSVSPWGGTLAHTPGRPEGQEDLARSKEQEPGA